MLYWLGQLLAPSFGPFRLLSSRLVLASLGVGAGAFLVWWFLPRLLHRLPRDRGREFSHDAEKSLGKPTGGGIILIPIYVAVCVLVVPWYDASDPASTIRYEPFAILVCTLLALATGFLDDRSTDSWGEYRKALLDLGITVIVAWVLCRGESATIWFPFLGGEVEVSPSIYIPSATALLWIAINSTNCTDGVDGLSASLLSLSLLYLAVILYVAVGHEDIAAYLLVPHVEMGADWAIMALTLMGVLGGYLWHNANPSSVLMGDAGSRPLGLLLGVFSLATGNPLLLFIIAAVVVVNGGTGLVKVALLRFLRIGIFRNVRFPLHDHCRKNLGWSNTQVLVRFMIVQAVLTPILVVCFLKVR